MQPITLLKPATLKDWLETTREKHATDYLPESLIQEIIQRSFPSSEVLHHYTKYHKIIKIKVIDLVKSPYITNWTYNRPPDMSRCPCIAQYIYNNKKPVDTMFHLSFDHKKCLFEILDGIHRYTALKIIYQENINPIDTIPPAEYGNNQDATEWLFNNYVIANIRFNASIGELIDIFQDINKSNPIPELYIKDVQKEKREIIETLCNQWQTKYKTHFSSSQKPNRPNINRDRFIDLLEKMYEKYNITEDNRQILYQAFEQANQYVQHNLPKKVPSSVIEKCIETGCYLFVHPVEKLEKLI
jgi:hypothetical protein